MWPKACCRHPAPSIRTPSRSRRKIRAGLDKWSVLCDLLDPLSCRTLFMKDQPKPSQPIKLVPGSAVPLVKLTASEAAEEARKSREELKRMQARSANGRKTTGGS